MSSRPPSRTATRVLLAGSAIITGGRHLIKDLPFDVNGFVPAAAMTETPFVVVVAGKSLA